MISAISGPLRSKRIHIGMDEAHGVSEGRYRQIFGYKDSTQVVSLRLLPLKTNGCTPFASGVRAAAKTELIVPIFCSSRHICAR